ncbi:MULTISPECIES: hypothetical protein [unclassified Paenibacillus]|uniref:hypothetical protein n=1 Tax=unclassified Paenibacillus TaxID=185978 RepID=UPI0030FBE5FA
MMATIEKTLSNPTNETTTPNRCSLIGLEVDDATLAQLLAFTRHHCKLALEHGKATTTQERRKEVIEEIFSLIWKEKILLFRLKAECLKRQDKVNGMVENHH